jgi:hypothetical protein
MGMTKLLFVFIHYEANGKRAEKKRSGRFG